MDSRTRTRRVKRLAYCMTGEATRVRRPPSRRFSRSCGRPAEAGHYVRGKAAATHSTMKRPDACRPAIRSVAATCTHHGVARSASAKRFGPSGKLIVLEPLAQLALLELARGRARDGVDELERVGQ